MDKDIKNINPIELCKKNKNLLVPWYLMACYMYYQELESIMSDSEFDSICKDLKKHWNSIEHRHKDLIDKGSLDAGTGYQIRFYPTMVKGAAYEYFLSR